ncbi:rod-binding protein [Thermotalea metallivorans]|uniref:Peptidoglycan hydrolase FlgJ n=1 Tax=Thermotalea metallivorans TaxID=520762 RepID=A0A140L6V1_9FIRM|nr:rod-binding protein [Thermotalea metallivorans]KXG76276.1 Peptidoglycan hydrolase FlgJ [Thermotalea metallivorans]
MKINTNLPIDINPSYHQKDKAQIEDFKQILEKAKENRDEKKLMETCKQLEAVFLNMVFKTMRSTVQRDGFIPRSFEREMFEGMLDEKVAENIAMGQGIGLAQQMYKQLSRNFTSGKNEDPDIE